MEIQRALPQDRYVKALNRSREAEWIEKRDRSIARVQEWMQDKRVNRKVKPALWFSGGKDSTACSILLKKAGIEHVCLRINNGCDMPVHDNFIPEIRQWLDIDARHWVEYRTDKTLLEYRLEMKRWGLLNGVTKKNGDPIDYFDLGPLEESYEWFTQGRFDYAYSDKDDVVYFNGARGAESMSRAFANKREGLWRRHEDKGFQPASLFQALPIGDWRDIDVWALLASENAPVSPTYAMNAIPQKQGKGSFPRTFWYGDPDILTATYYRWLQRYASEILRTMIEMFPEITERFRAPSK